MIKNTLLYNILEQIANNTDIEVLIDIIKDGEKVEGDTIQYV